MLSGGKHEPPQLCTRKEEAEAVAHDVRVLLPPPPPPLTLCALRAPWSCGCAATYAEEIAAAKEEEAAEAAAAAAAGKDRKDRESKRKMNYGDEVRRSHPRLSHALPLVGVHAVLAPVDALFSGCHV